MIDGRLQILVLWCLLITGMPECQKYWWGGDKVNKTMQSPIIKNGPIRLRAEFWGKFKK